MILRIAVVFALLLGAPLTAWAAGTDGSSPVRDSTFQLNISEKRIEAGPYYRALEVALDKPLSLRIGVALRAAHLDVLLRGIQGTVQFHGDLSRITRLFNAHSPTAPAR